MRCARAYVARMLRVPTLFLVFSLCFSELVVADDPTIEIMHWWYRGGDARAISVIEDEVASRGGKWHGVAAESSTELMNGAMSRMAKGYAPTLVQWNSLWEIGQIHKLGLLNTIGPKVSKKLRENILDSVLDVVSVNEEIIAIPVNVHSENWLWYKPTYTTLEHEGALHDWAGFLDFADNLSNEGRIALAVGDESWQQRILFNNVLLAAIGKPSFESLYSELNGFVIDSVEFAEALELFTRLNQYAKSFGEGRWDQQVAAVAANHAFAVSMGDWAKGEFRNLGLRPGRGYECVAAPGTQNKLILLFDVFAMGQVESEAERKGQKLFVDVVIDRDVSETFNYLKGSLPPLKDIDADSLDKCNRIAHASLVETDTAIMPFASTGDRSFQADIERLISKLWAGETTAEQWSSEFKTLLKVEKDRRKSFSITSIEK